MEHYVSEKIYTEAELKTFNALFRDVHPYTTMREIGICGIVETSVILDAFNNFLEDVKEENCNMDNALDQYLLRLTYPEGFQ